MYNKLDYIKRGFVFLNNIIFPSNKKLSSLFFYTTSLCDSQCKHCLVWQKRPVTHMSKDKIVEIMQSKCVSKDTTVGLEGGEFLLHPESTEILKWFYENHPNFELLSNCLKPEKVIDAVKKSPPKRLYISLDGDKETYEYMRGRDGYDKVLEVIEACKDIVPISLMFTLSPYNGFEAMHHVINIANKYDLDIRIGIYNNISFFDTKDKAHTKDDKFSTSDIRSNITEDVINTSENADFLLLYDEWKNGNLKMKCFSIKDSLVIHPDGNVPLCQKKDTSLGNVYENSLDEILRSHSTLQTQNFHLKNCNECWINFHRKYDIVFLRTLEKMFPKRLIELFYGKYQWAENPKVSYKEFLKEHIK